MNNRVEKQYLKSADCMHTSIHLCTSGIPGATPFERQFTRSLVPENPRDKQSIKII